MDVFSSLMAGEELSQMRTVGMHTAGEPTRIILQGFPHLIGRTLLEKRANAKAHHDGIRKRLMHEPRGHRDMYGAILVQETELVQSGKADIGVLFCHNEGFSTMCGHATLALGRFLVDTHDTVVFPKREFLTVDFDELRTTLILHAPCGPVNVSVPILPHTAALGPGPIKSDPSRPVSFFSVPSFASAADLVLQIPGDYSWPELTASGSNEVKLDIAFGGAFYAIVTVQSLGFSGRQPLRVGLDSGNYSIAALDRATRLLKAYISNTPELKALLRHPTSPEFEYLYGITVIDPPRLQFHPSGESPNSDVGLCFFADQQIDRSPTGSCVCARVALALAKRERELEVPWIYHSVLTSRKGEGAFTGRAVECVLLAQLPRGGLGREEASATQEAWVIKVEGHAYYTDAATFALEQGDTISKDGFTL